MNEIADNHCPTCRGREDDQKFVTFFMGLIVLMIFMTFPLVAKASLPDGVEKQDGYLPFYWDEEKGQVLLEVPELDTDILYFVSVAQAPGSVELPVDRGILKNVVIHFHRSGPNVLVIEQNLDFRAAGGSDERARNVSDSFATSVLAALPVVEEGQKLVVDGTSLFMRDAAGVEARAAQHGSFSFNAAKSGFYTDRMKAFPENTEIETIATFEVKHPNVVVRNILPDARVMSLRIHHSFLKAPQGYTPRQADPRIGVSKITFSNLAQPFDDETEESWIARFRLEKKDPSAALSEPVKPIVFYMDPSIPDDIRVAMKEGTLWWNEAFEEAGFKNAVQVKDPEPGMDPMDIRYAWVQWIERDGRGFSMSGSFRDPRTGEVLGSKTRMDSHRIRTVANYYEAYVKAAESAGADMTEAERAFGLARQRVLVAHELGHVLGFGHNWASSINERASVMEYPSPRVRVKNGRLDLSEAFAVGVGEYDKYMVRYAYTPFEEGNEKAGLNNIITEMQGSDILYVPRTDPRWQWYDDLASPDAYFDETLAARDIMLSQYGPDMLETGEPLGHLRDMKLWMVYLHHRWAIESAQRFVGGMYHAFSLKGDGTTPTEIVPRDLQVTLLDKLLVSVSPEKLALPESLLKNLTVHPGLNREDMSDDYAFDPLKAGRILSAMVISPLLTPQKSARMVAFQARDPGTLTFPEMVSEILAASWGQKIGNPSMVSALQRVTQQVVLESLMILGADDDTVPDVKAYVMMELEDLAADIQGKTHKDALTQAHYKQSFRLITRYLTDPKKYAPETSSAVWGIRPMSRYPMPPGPPL